MAARKPPAPKTLAGITATGDRRAALVALRDHLAKTLETADRDVASLARQLQAVLREIDELPTLQQESTVDDLANRRTARRAKAANQ